MIEALADVTSPWVAALIAGFIFLLAVGVLGAMIVSIMRFLGDYDDSRNAGTDR